MVQINQLLIIIDFIFKFSLSIFIILFFSSNNDLNLKKEDRLIIIMSGFILIILIDYIQIINILFNKKYRDERCNYLD
jgi:hypothetical protein